MRGSSLHRSWLLLAFGLALACSSPSRESETEASPEASPRGPIVGEPAPPLALASLSGERVQLPVSDSKRATVLIFGSFS